MANKHESVSAVRSYLIARFTDCAVDDRFDFDTRGQVFTIEHGGARVWVVRVSREFLADVESSEIGKLLLAWNLDKALRTSSDVFVTQAGLRSGQRRGLTPIATIPAVLGVQPRPRTCLLCR